MGTDFKLTEATWEVQTSKEMPKWEDGGHGTCHTRGQACLTYALMGPEDSLFLSPRGSLLIPAKLGRWVGRLLKCAKDPLSSSPGKGNARSRWQLRWTPAPPTLVSHPHVIFSFSALVPRSPSLAPSLMLSPHLRVRPAFSLHLL